MLAVATCGGKASACRLRCAGGPRLRWLSPTAGPSEESAARRRRGRADAPVATCGRYGLGVSAAVRGRAVPARAAAPSRLPSVDRATAFEVYRGLCLEAPTFAPNSKAERSTACESQSPGVNASVAGGGSAIAQSQTPAIASRAAIASDAPLSPRAGAIRLALLSPRAAAIAPRRYRPAPAARGARARCRRFATGLAGARARFRAAPSPDSAPRTPLAPTSPARSSPPSHRSPPASSPAAPRARP